MTTAAKRLRNAWRYGLRPFIASPSRTYLRRTWRILTGKVQFYMNVEFYINGQRYTDVVGVSVERVN